MPTARTRFVVHRLDLFDFVVDRVPARGPWVTMCHTKRLAYAKLIARLLRDNAKRKEATRA